MQPRDEVTSLRSAIEESRIDDVKKLLEDEYSEDELKHAFNLALLADQVEIAKYFYETKRISISRLEDLFINYSHVRENPAMGQFVYQLLKDILTINAYGYRILDENVSDSFGRTLLHYAVKCNVLTEDMLISLNKNINKEDTFGYTPLSLFASIKNSVATAKLLIKHGAIITSSVIKAVIDKQNLELIDLFCSDRTNATTALYYLVKYRNYDEEKGFQLVKDLLQKGADPTFTEEERSTFELAVMNGEEELIKLLLNSKYIQDSDIQKGMTIAVDYEDQDVVTILNQRILEDIEKDLNIIEMNLAENTQQSSPKAPKKMFFSKDENKPKDGKNEEEKPKKGFK